MSAAVVAQAVSGASVAECADSEREIVGWMLRLVEIAQRIIALEPQWASAAELRATLPPAIDHAGAGEARFARLRRPAYLTDPECEAALDDAIGIALRLTCERRELLAHLRWNLAVEAGRIIDQLRVEGVEITSGLVADSLMFAVARARPRSHLVPWHLADSTVARMIPIATADAMAMARLSG
jgi:hypothetical protein